MEEEVCGETIENAYYDVKYLLGGSEKKVKETFIACTPNEKEARQAAPRDIFTVEAPEVRRSEGTVRPCVRAFLLRTVPGLIFRWNGREAGRLGAVFMFRVLTPPDGDAFLSLLGNSPPPPLDPARQDFPPHRSSLTAVLFLDLVWFHPFRPPRAIHHGAALPTPQ